MQFQIGSSLLEVLITLVILSTGLLGFAHAGLMALRTNQSAYLQSLAKIQLNSMGERLRSCQHSGIISINCLKQEVATWKKENARLLPDASSALTIQDAAYELKIHWVSESNQEKKSVLTETIILLHPN